MSKIFPAIPDPHPTPESLAESVRSLKIGMELLTGQRPGAQPSCTFVQAAVPTPVSVGDRWVDNDGVERYWTGVEWRKPVVVPTWTEGVKTSSDQSVTSSTTATDATDLSFSVAANLYYAFEFVLLFTGASGGLKVNMTFPTSPTAVYYAVTSSLNSTVTGGATAAGTDLTVFSTVPATWVNAVSVVGFLSNGANAGAVQMKFAQQTSNATATVLKKGSWFRYRTV